MMEPGALEKLVRLRELCRTGVARARRLEAPATLDEVGSAAGVDRTTIWRWENGKTRPTGPAALRYAALLEMLAREEANR